MVTKKIKEGIRFTFFNFYAFLLIALGVGVFFVPVAVFLIILKIVLAFFFVLGSFTIFRTWNRKKRILNLLLMKNKEGIKEDSFKPFMHDLCTQLIVLYVLVKMGRAKLFGRLFIEEMKERF